MSGNIYCMGCGSYPKSVFIVRNSNLTDIHYFSVKPTFPPKIIPVLFSLHT